MLRNGNAPFEIGEQLCLIFPFSFHNVLFFNFSLYTKFRSLPDLGADHPYTAQSLNNLALLYQSQGRYSEAENLFRRSLDIVEKQLGADHPSTATSLNNLAALYQSQGKKSQALEFCQRALDIFEQHLGSNHPNTINVRDNLKSLQIQNNLPQSLWGKILVIIVGVLILPFYFIGQCLRWLFRRMLRR